METTPCMLLQKVLLDSPRFNVSNGECSQAPPLCIGLQVTFMTVISNDIIKHLLNTKWIAFYVQLLLAIS